MAHIRSCIVIAEGAILSGATLVAMARHGWYLRRGRNYSLANALGSGAVGGFLGAAGGTALCVVRDGTANPGGGWLSAWLFRLLPFGTLGVVEGAVIGVVVGVAMAWVVSRRARRSIGA